MIITVRGNYTIDELVNWLEQNIGYRTMEKRSLIQGSGWSITPTTLPMEGFVSGVRVEHEWVVNIEEEKFAVLFKLKWL